MNLEITRQFEIDGQRIYVIDDLFDQSTIAALANFYASKPFLKKEYTPELHEVGAGKAGLGRSGKQHPIIHWNFDHKLEDLHTIPPFKRVFEVTSQLYAETPLNLKRLHVNRFAFGDIETPHRDSSDVTSILYVHAEWDILWGAELVFFDKNFEALYSVAPKPGRLVVFDGGQVIHRAGVPFQNCYASKFSAAFKFVKVRP